MAAKLVYMKLAGVKPGIVKLQVTPQRRGRVIECAKRAHNLELRQRQRNLEHTQLQRRIAIANREGSLSENEEE